MAAVASYRKAPDVNIVKELEYERARAAESQRQLTNYKKKLQTLQSHTEMTKKYVSGAVDELQLAKDAMAFLKVELEKAVEERDSEIQKSASLHKMVEDLEKEAQNSAKTKEKADDDVFSMRSKVLKLQSTILFKNSDLTPRNS
ncbi:uncharacterized protein LOC116617486 [Nematostella vectensis]|uniref:uncharacterized protein LOC116617486 n=1 Tax=Nematostella vectensis TaxID=45351 RepID=UPI0020775882|nr:uncharacterized protein LOC116617486 [Nematostella vectensis]